MCCSGFYACDLKSPIFPFKAGLFKPKSTSCESYHLIKIWILWALGQSHSVETLNTLNSTLNFNDKWIQMNSFSVIPKHILIKAIPPTLYQVSLTLPRSVHFSSLSASPAHCTEAQKQQSTDEKQKSQNGDGWSMGAETVGYRCDCNSNDQENHTKRKGTARAGPLCSSSGCRQLCSINQGWTLQRRMISAHGPVEAARVLNSLLSGNFLVPLALYWRFSS